MEGVGSAEAIDTVMKLGANHPMGPLTLADFIGLDVVLAVMRALWEGLGDPKYRPCPLLVRMVDAGYLGRKTGRGFYTYDGKERDKGIAERSGEERWVIKRSSIWSPTGLPSSP